MPAAAPSIPATAVNRITGTIIESGRATDNLDIMGACPDFKMESVRGTYVCVFAILAEMKLSSTANCSPRDSPWRAAAGTGGI